MSRTKKAYWPYEGRTPRPPYPIRKALRAAWGVQQQSAARMADPFLETK